MSEPDTLDLRGTRCPLNYVKTRLRLDRMEPGQSLLVLLDRGEPEEQVPRSLEMDGHTVGRLGEPDGADGFARILVRRKA